MRKIDFNLNESLFKDFTTSRYSMSSKIDVRKTWDYSKENDLSFFVLSLGALLNGVNSNSNLKRRIINNEVYEFDNLDGVFPILNENEEMLEVRVGPPNNFKSFDKWYDYVIKEQNNVLNDDTLAFKEPMDKRDEIPIANFSCIPWVDFETLTSCICDPHQCQPLITWGKVNEDFKMSVAITVSHIFVFGKDLGKFYTDVQKNFNTINKI
ncbi:CatA-like O-acetyltransferase [Methanobrevibacter sp. DSM 116169]|uniref:CatA-like O-acetyltransferase n=1 Tax=Methanobrevibacter sp. DSM 116169 TaxID=3242727 RepID=UPI0038FCF55E